MSGINLKSSDKSVEASIEELRHSCAGVFNRDIFADLLSQHSIGIELGVASAGFSKRLLSINETLFLYGVDMWAGDRGHDTAQYKQALRELAPYKNRNCLIRARFDETVDLFDDHYFDFVYVDGYAHTGEEGGQTFLDWYPKVKPFGIIAGDDYHSDWPLVMKAVDGFLAEHSIPLFTIANSWNPGLEWRQWFSVKGSLDDENYIDAMKLLRKKFLASTTQVVR